MLKKPVIDSSAFVAPNATVLGDVTIAANERSAAFYVEEGREYKKELGL